jgi:cell wall-associated NlpC family hydrolase
VAERGVSAVAVGAVGAGVILVWSGLKGSSVLSTLQSVIQGKKPAGEQTHPIAHEVADVTVSAAAAIGAASSSQLVTLAARHKGERYCFTGQHGSFCGGSCSDCSGFVSCVLHEAGLLGGHPLATGALATWGTGVPYSQRRAGDVIVWNGGTGGGHTGIIIDGSHMWANPCTGCGGVQISRYPYGNRTAAAAVVRRAKTTGELPRQSTTAGL